MPRSKLSDEERKAKKNAWQKKNRTRPEVRARLNEKNKERMREYNKKPEVIERRKEYNASPERQVKARERYVRPETKETMKKYRASPHGKAKMKEYYTSTKVKAKKRELNASPKGKAKMKEYNTRPEVKARQNQYEKLRWARPEVKAKRREYEARPEVRERRSEYRARPEVKVKGSKTTREKKDIVKREVYLHYSKIHSNSDIPCCRCCGLNSHIEFLSLDHIAGKKQMDSERELLTKGYSSKLKIHQLLPWIKRNNFPTGFQILCLNCNFAKGHSKDNKCPHENEKK